MGISTSSATRRPTSSKRARRKAGDLHSELYCAIYTPHFGNFYHWAFTVFNGATREWHIFEVVQDEQDGPFRAERRLADPQRSHYVMDIWDVIKQSDMIDKDTWNTAGQTSKVRQHVYYTPA
ncbi:hypothetical protein QBC40DRAFT_294359 [Triangularia verruculosa]|uniref:Uncharacterized protein n=1 Tax=Triangularia verruculosa TaxID=2587418 RepID=A0AAN7AVQ6_9PEZI|nr:hypothetical protein QBC40DRAFT_294359 [Triangularia verruculosa]